jgi:hypothetical protein
VSSIYACRRQVRNSPVAGSMGMGGRDRMPTMAEAPPTRRRWFSYSLRSLLVLIALAAVGLAWVAYERRQSQRELLIAEQLQAGGFEVGIGGLFDPDPSDSSWQPGDEPSWWRRTLSSLFGHRIREVNLYGDRPLANLSLLADLTSLRDLRLDTSNINDLSPLAGLRSLRELHFDETVVSDLSPLSNLGELECLILSGTQVSDLAPLAGLNRLAVLCIDGTQVVDLAPIAGLKHLAGLTLADTRISDLEPLVGLENLVQLFLDRTAVTDLAPLTRHNRLLVLSLEDTQVADLSPLAGLEALEELNLDNTRVTDLSPLAGLESLASLSLRGTAVYEEQVKQLQEALPRCSVSSDDAFTMLMHIMLRLARGLYVTISGTSE